jgi:hypothetical protein
MRCSTAQERVVDAWVVGCVEINDAFMNAFFLDEI